MTAPKDTEVLAQSVRELRRNLELRWTGPLVENAVNTLDVAADTIERLSALRQQPSDEVVRLLGEAREMIRRTAHFSGDQLIARIDAALAGNPAATPEQSK